MTRPVPDGPRPIQHVQPLGANNGSVSLATRDESPLEPELRTRLDALMEEGAEIGYRFDRDVRQQHWHPFIPADYHRVLPALMALRAPGRRFLEWGSATGVIAIMADLLGFDACGIELDPSLVTIAGELASRYEAEPRFAVGSFLPREYRWKPGTGDARLGTIGDGASAYAELGLGLDDFDLVYAYPWGGEEPMMLDLMRCYGGSGAYLLLNGDNGVSVYWDGKLVASADSFQRL